MSVKNAQFLLVGMAVVAIILAVIAFTQQQQAANNEATAITQAAVAAAGQGTSDANAATARADSEKAATAQANAEFNEATAIARAEAAATAHALADTAKLAAQAGESTAVALANAAVTSQFLSESGQATAIAQYSLASTAQALAEATRDAAISAQTTAAARAAEMATAQSLATPVYVVITVPVVITTTPQQTRSAPVEQTILPTLPDNCIAHVVVEGDTPFSIAESYGVDGFDLLQVNGLTEETLMLQLGQVLIVPFPDCELLALAATSSPTVEPIGRPTLTLPPTAINASVQILEVTGVGDVAVENVVLRNNGSTVNLRGWVLSDEDGNTYTFSERVLFANAQVTVFSRIGQDTAIAMYWNRDDPVFAPGDIVTLRDADGAVQSVVRVP